MTKPVLVAVSLFCGLAAVLVAPLAFWPPPLAVGPVIAHWSYACLSVGLAAELTETLLALVWPRVALPAANGAPPRHTTAIVMTVCDDWTGRCFSALEPLADAGYAVFVLDDSTQPATLPPGLIGKIEVLRRESRRGAKGGNLNHWLRRCGPQFVYAIVLDADSIIPVETVDALLATAEHPANGDVAIVQSKIDVEVEAPSTFARAVGAAARPRARILERVHARLGVLLSSGHNELLRLAPVFSIGGFDERLTNEDTVLSLHLAARGWRTVLADVWSYNAEPDTTAAYNRRTVRWARQTLELFQHDWYEVPLRLKLLLCRHLMMFVLPILGTWLLGLSPVSYTHLTLPTKRIV